MFEAKDIDVGDLIQMQEWRDDTWAEVLFVGVLAVTIVEYQDGGRERSSRMVHISRIKRVSDYAGATASGKVFHFSFGYQNHNKHVLWTHRMTNNSPVHEKLGEK